MTAELMTAEIMVGTPATSGPASCVESKLDMCIGVDYDNPAEYIDMYLYGYGVDRECSSIRRTKDNDLKVHVLQLANTGVSQARSVAQL